MNVLLNLRLLAGLRVGAEPGRKPGGWFQEHTGVFLLQTTRMNG
jgi:hypothetical protein